MSSRGQPQKMMGFVTQRVGSTVSTLCGIAWFAIPGNRSSRRPHGWCEICNELSRLILSVCNAMSELQPLLSSTRRRTSTDYTELLPDRHGLAPRFSALSHVHLHPHPARDEHCCAHAVLPEQVPGCSAGHAQGAGPFWPGLALPLACTSMSLLHAARSRPRPQAGPPIGGCGISAHLVGATMIRQRLVIL